MDQFCCARMYLSKTNYSRDRSSAYRHIYISTGSVVCPCAYALALRMCVYLFCFPIRVLYYYYYLLFCRRLLPIIIHTYIHTLLDIISLSGILYINLMTNTIYTQYKPIMSHEIIYIYYCTSHVRAYIIYIMFISHI